MQGFSNQQSHCKENSVVDAEKSYGLTSSDISVSSIAMPCHTRLPLWIPDVDAHGKVIIPSPRADPYSKVGVYPRPIGFCNPHRTSVLEQFRFIGRLFASALRDGFIFPLPLSPYFLKLVLTGVSRAIETGSNIDFRRRHHNVLHDCSSSLGSNDNNSNLSLYSSSPIRRMSIDEYYCGDSNSLDKMRNENSNSSFSHVTGDGISDNHHTQSTSFFSDLDSKNLPRPGFLGGEIFAVEQHICTALNRLDSLEPNISEEELEQQKDAIASDKSFARIALGKSYDCSFNEYFIDKVFVDPLDPSQGEEAAPLCRDGASIPVTIDNVREWVRLSKIFFLYDGVIAQACEFRNGVNDFFSANALRVFTPEELYHDVCGGGDSVDKWDENAIRSLFKLDGGKGAAEALVAVAAMGGEGGAALSRRFGPSSPTIGYLVKALLEANITQRRQFLSFVTSVPIVTPGQIEVVPVVNPAGEFLVMNDPSCLPRSNTCARRLYLPKFDSYDSFVMVLWSVVREECRFKGFYEWRG